MQKIFNNSSITFAEESRYKQAEQTYKKALSYIQMMMKL